MDKPVVSTELRILLLEDMPTDAALAENALREAGLSFTAKRVDARESFILALEEFKPDIVLADYKLPAFDGGSALQIVRQQYPTIPVLMVTGAMGDDKAVELLKLGARDYVLKDRLARLGPAVRRALSEEQGIRARKAAEKVLRASEVKFRSVVETTSDWLWEVNGQGIYTYASPQVYNLLGYTPDEVIGKTPFDLMPTEEAARVSAIFSSIVAEKKSFQLLENTCLHKDGHAVILETSGVPVVDDNGIFQGYRGIDRDITERKQVEKELRASEQKFMRFFMLMPIPLAVVNADGVITHSNDRFTEILGYTRDDVPTLQEWWQLAYPDESYRRWVQDTWSAAVAKAAKEGVDIEPIEYRVACKSGAERIMLIGGAYIEGTLLATLIDITERKQAEIKLAEQLNELRRWHEATLGREMRTLELKHEVNELLAQAGQPPRYPSAEADKTTS